jgi:hypothetical protein
VLAGRSILVTVVPFIVGTKKLAAVELPDTTLRSTGGDRRDHLGGNRVVRAGVPGTSLVPDLVVVGLILAGGLYFAIMLIFNREVLDTEPGIPDAF